MAKFHYGSGWELQLPTDPAVTVSVVVYGRTVITSAASGTGIVPPPIITTHTTKDDAEEAAEALVSTLVTQVGYRDAWNRLQFTVLAEQALVDGALNTSLLLALFRGKGYADRRKPWMGEHEEW